MKKDFRGAEVAVETIRRTDSRLIARLAVTAMAAAALALTGCHKGPDYDAEGFFEGTEVIVSAEGTGKLLDFTVNEGDSLHAGQLVGIIDTTQLALKQSQLEHQQEAVSSESPDIAKQVSAIRARLSLALTEQRRVSNLLRDGAATQQQMDNANAAVKAIEGELQAALSTLRNTRSSISSNASAVGYGQAQVADLIDKCHVTSPINGTVLAKYAEAGEMAVAGHPLFKVCDLDSMWLRAYVTSDQLADIKLGQKATVYADYGGGETREYPGRVTWIASDSEFTPKSVQTKDSRANLVYAVKVAVKNDDGRLKIGFYGGVDF